jgi:hypothetical protein
MWRCTSKNPSKRGAFVGQDNITDLRTYMRAHANELGKRILTTYPALHQIEDPPSPRLSALLRQPFPAQTLAVMGIVKRWNQAPIAKVIAECGTGKTLISLGAMYVHSEGRPFTALAMVPRTSWKSGLGKL